MNKFQLTIFCFLAVGITQPCYADTDEINEMRPIKIIKGMTSYKTEKNGTEEIYTYEFDLVGRALVARTNRICDFRKNTVVGYQEIELLKGDGTTIKASIPVIEKFIVTGVCNDLRKEYFSK
ncbi:MAG: hypothetical protein PHP70_12625 [Gallionella sp.]|nr:hypothetical protein [Gallionella sp.]